MKRGLEKGFVVDAQLGRLARYLRFGGFDTLYFREKSLEELRRLSRDSGRILLSRSGRIAADENPLFLRILPVEPESQLRQLALALPLRETFRPFSRCMLCNTPLEKVGREAIAGSVPERVFAREKEFRRCPDCGRIYWPGDHYRRMLRLWEGIFDETEKTLDFFPGER